MQKAIIVDSDKGTEKLNSYLEDGEWVVKQMCSMPSAKTGDFNSTEYATCLVIIEKVI